MATKKEFEGRFEETGKNIDQMLSNTSDKFREERQELKNKWNTLDEKRGGVADNDDSAWDNVKEEMEEGWNDLQDSYNDMKENFKEDGHEGHNH